MKKIFSVSVIVLVFIVAGNTAYSQKTGYISVDGAVSLMPETVKLDTIMAQFEKDSIGSQYNYIVSEYQRNDSIFKDTTKPQAIRNMAGQQMQAYLGQLQNWQEYASQLYQQKQNQLLVPIYAKVQDAIKAVAKEGGYTYVYRAEALIVAPPADDLLPAVAKKLNLKLPATYKPGFQ